MIFRNSQRLFSGLVVIISVALLNIQPTRAQQILDIHMKFNHAKDLYQRSAYKAARAEFAKCLDDPYLAESTYFMASSAIRAGQLDGESLMHEFVRNYPFHVYAQNAYFDIADYYFGNGKYKESLKNYNKSAAYLSTARIFKKGYCYFFLDQYDQALTSFQKLDESFSTYQNDAAYFRGYIYHSRKEFKKSYEFLTDAFESEKYRKPAMELYASTLYRKAEYKALITLVETELSPVDNGVVLNFLADSQYALEKYRSAAKNYKDLFKSYARRRNERNYFRAGYSSYKIENKDDAINYLKRSAVVDDSVGAYASYYLGIIYKQNDNLPYAITSFENTAKYPTVIREDALFHQAKCMMEMPNYQGAIGVLDTYKSSYAMGRFIVQVNEMLGVAHAQTNNYDLAIRYIEDLDRLTPQLKMTYQRVSFLKGVELFNDKKFSLSAEVFQKALIHDEDASITQQTYYWIGEALSLLDQHDEALFYYQSVSRKPDASIYLKAVYGRAYGHFNLKKYDDAALSFKQFETEYTQTINKKYLSDALLRMGDCQFALKNYQQGIDYYGKAEKSGNQNSGHIYFQIGLLNRYLDNDVKAKQYFNKLIKEIPKSTKADHAYFQIAQIDFEEGKGLQAIKAFDTFLSKYPSSSFVPFALLNQAVAYENEGNSEQSVENYKAILDRFPRHQAANSALLGLQDKNSSGEFDEFDEYLRKFKQANPNSEALENIEFESARANYYDQKYELAIKGFKTFIKSYSNSSLVSESYYFIGDAYYRQEQIDKSLEFFKKLESELDYSKYPKVLYRIASIESKMGNFPESNDSYYQLSKVSLSSRNVINVHSGLMENHFAVQSYDSALYYGNSLLNNARVGVLVGANASLIIGKSQYAMNNLEEAKESLLPLVSNAPDERGAEAYYYISKIYYDQAKYERALESLFVLTNNFRSYEIWVGEAYLLMADIYIETDELFQAKATLNSLIEHAAMDEIKKRAESKLELIENSIDSNE